MQGAPARDAADATIKVDGVREPAPAAVARWDAPGGRIGSMSDHKPWEQRPEPKRKNRPWAWFTELAHRNFVRDRQDHYAANADKLPTNDAAPTPAPAEP